MGTSGPATLPGKSIAASLSSRRGQRRIRSDPASNITVGDVNCINDRGEIAATGILPNSVQYAILLIPDGDCDDLEVRIAAIQSKVAL
jgi:hypothetical protein